MRNFKIFIDICDIYLEILKLDTTRYTMPFMIMFVEADDPDGACNTAMFRIMDEIMCSGVNIQNRILCRKLRRKIRIERIQSL